MYHLHTKPIVTKCNKACHYPRYLAIVNTYTTQQVNDMARINTAIIEKEVKSLENYITRVLSKYWNFDGGTRAYVRGIGNRSESLKEALDLAKRTFPHPTKDANDRKQLQDAINQYRRDYGLVILSVLVK